MALSTALMLAPTALRTISDLTGIGKSKKSKYEKELLNMADIFGNEAKAPVTQSRAFQSGKSELDARDKKNRRAINNQSAVFGATDDAKLATVQNSNENYNSGLNQLLAFASRLKDVNMSRYLNTMGAAEGARQGRLAKDQNAWANILNPLSQAGQALAMSKLYGNEAEG